MEMFVVLQWSHHPGMGIINPASMVY